MSPESSRLYVITESVATSLSTIISDPFPPLSEASVAYIVKEILLGLVYLHSEHLVHRDVKAGNIFLTEGGGVKISEFGVASRLKGFNASKLTTYVGTPLWMAPEMIDQNPDFSQNEDLTKGYDEAVDIWSLGIACMEVRL